MTKYRYEYGKRWDARVPRRDVNYLMGRVHVGTPDAEVEADIRRRCEGKPGYTPGLVEQSVRYAIECHQRNRELFRHVMGGGR